jgi:hypothetical protein
MNWLLLFSVEIIGHSEDYEERYTCWELRAIYFISVLSLTRLPEVNQDGFTSLLKMQ